MSTTGSQELSDTSKSALQARALPVIGMSGARCSTALKILGEDCESFDGLPASLVPALIDGAAANRPATAARVDRPARCFRAEPALDPLANRVLPRGRGLRVFFVDSDDDRFECRYTETLRSHPLAGDRPVMDGIRPERQMLSALRDRADLLIDTSLPTAPVAERPFAVGLAVADGGLRVFVTSFACLRGTLRAAYLLSGVGRPENRGHVEVSRALTGTDPAVSASCEKNRDLRGFLMTVGGGRSRRRSAVRPAAKTYLTIAVGRTNGRHRLVYAAQRLPAKPREVGWQAVIAHRDFPLRTEGSPAVEHAPLAATD